MELVWIVLVSGAVLAGAGTVAVLVVRQTFELPFALASITGLGAAFFAFARISQHYKSDSLALWAIAFLVAATAGGYALASTLLYRLIPTPGHPSLPAVLPADNGIPAVLVVACDEPESYRPRFTAELLQSLSDEGVLDVSIGALPLLFFAQKARYRAIGGVNPAASQLALIAERLDSVVHSGRVSGVGCNGPHGLLAAVNDAIQRGHRSIIVAELSVGESDALHALDQALERMPLSEAGIVIRHTGVLWCSDRVIGMVAARVGHVVGQPEETGVVLVGHGQPPRLSQRSPRMDEEENSFLSRLRMTLIETGLPPANVRIAWADWGSPDITSTVRQLAASGCSRVVVTPAAFPLDTIATRLDLEISVRQARVGESATIVTLPPWKDDPAVIEELRLRVAEAIARP